MEYLIRLANKNDAQELSKLKHSVWSTTYRGIYSDEKIDNYDFDKNKDKFIDIINNSEMELYVVEHDGKLLDKPEIELYENNNCYIYIPIKDKQN